MIYIKDKMNYVNNDTGFLTANEFNSMKNELANIVKYRNVLADNDDSQLLKAIVAESKTLFYTDNGTVNAIELKRSNEIDFSLDDDQVFIFSPSNTNTGVTTIKIGNNTERRLLLNNAELPVGFLNSNITYMATYKKATDAFEIKNLTIGNTSDFIFSNLHNESTFVEVTDLELGTGLYNNAVVFINQTNGKYELGIIENPRTQKQNAIGIYKIIGSKKYVFFDGIVPDFVSGLTSGFKYYLSTTTAGGINNGSVNNTVLLGRYLKDGKFLLDISGDVSIDNNAISYKVFTDNITNGDNLDGVIFTDDSGLFNLMYDRVTFNPAGVKKVMYANVNDIVFKIEFVPEYLNREFHIEYNNNRYTGIFTVATVISNSIDLYLLNNTPTDTTAPILSSTNKSFTTTAGTPLTLETVTASDNKNGDLVVTQTGTVNFNVAGTYNVAYSARDVANNATTIHHTYTVEALPVIATYNVNIKHLQTSNGITITEPTNTLTLMFNNIAFDRTIPADIMFISANGVIAKFDYAMEYVGKIFEIELSGVRYIGVFAKNESYVSPTILNIK